MILEEAQRAIEGTKTDFSDIENKSKHFMTLAFAAVGAIAYLYFQQEAIKVDPIYVAPILILVGVSMFFLARSLTLSEFSSGGIKLKEELQAYLDPENDEALKKNILIARTNAFRRNKKAISSKGNNLSRFISLLTIGAPLSAFLCWLTALSAEIVLDGWHWWLAILASAIGPVIFCIWHSTPPLEQNLE